MRAIAVTAANAAFQLEERPVPEPAPSEVRLRVHAWAMVERFSLADAGAAYARMMSGEARFRVVLETGA